MLIAILAMVVLAAACDPLVTLDPKEQMNLTAHLGELPVPPTVPSDGTCTSPTGCITGDWNGIGSPGFMWDKNYVLVGVTYTGAPSSGPASVFTGPQVIVVRTDGGHFPDGDAWKCITCGVAAANEPGIIAADYLYPPAHALPGDKQILVGNGILQCGTPTVTYAISDPRCTPDVTHIYPIYWGSAPLGSGLLGAGREWRLSPDGVHLVWNELIFNASTVFEYGFYGRLTWNPADQRYDLTNVSILNSAPEWTVGPGNVLTATSQQQFGELRGFSGDGQSILGFFSKEGDNVDATATSIATGASRFITNHAEYIDPMSMSPNGKYLLGDEVAGSGRLDFISGMRGTAPLSSLITIAYVSSIRNNGNRRFFRPWLVEVGGKGRSQNLEADASQDWNAAADPVWLADNTAAVWTENLACGANPTPHQCTDSTESGGRNSRLMIARFPGIHPNNTKPPAPTSDTLSWGTPYTQGDPLPSPSGQLAPGSYTLPGTVGGSASVVITDNAAATAIAGVSVTYHDFSDLKGYIINGTEDVTSTNAPSPLAETVTWNDDLTLSGLHTGTKKTGPGGFTVGPSVLLSNDLEATGSMVTTIDGQIYIQPANGT